MAIPFFKEIKIGAYLLKQKMLGRKRYPLVLMLEPLFRCNLACAGCGKIDYPDEILNRRMTAQECLDATEECGAPVVSIPGGEPLLHQEMARSSRDWSSARSSSSSAPTRCCSRRRSHLYEPRPIFSSSIHLDGRRNMHDKSVCQDGVYDKAVAAIKAAKAKGFRVTVNAPSSTTVRPRRSPTSSTS